ncbi:MAG: DUF58 domain-containing protein [Cytophagales bacterium]
MPTFPKIDFATIRSIGNIEFLAKQVVEGFMTGLHKSPYHGFSVEFAEHRQYNTGESTRFIDWKIYNRTDKLYTKRFEEETNLRCSLVVDISSSMYYPIETNGKLLFSVLAAASLAYLLQKQRDAFSLTTFTDKIVYQSQIKSTSSHLRELFNTCNLLLNEKPAMVSTDLPTILHQIAEKTHKRSMIVIFSDFFEGMENKEALFDALKHLKHLNHEVLVFNVADKKTELQFEFEDKPYWFTDLETGEKMKLNPSQLRSGYTEVIESYLQELKIKCGQYKIDFNSIDINESFSQIFMPFLAKRSRMK